MREGALNPRFILGSTCLWSWSGAQGLGLYSKRGWRAFCELGGEWAETGRENSELTRLRAFLANQQHVLLSVVRPTGGSELSHCGRSMEPWALVLSPNTSEAPLKV